MAQLAFVACLAESISWGSLFRPLVLNRPYPIEVTNSVGQRMNVTVLSGPAVIANNQLTATHLGMIELGAYPPGEVLPGSPPPFQIQLNHTRVEFTQLASVPELTNAVDVDLSQDGRLALVPSGRDGVSVVDLSDPAAPRIRGQIRSDGEFAYSRRARLVVDLAFVLVTSVGLEIWNVQDPDRPALLGVAQAGSMASDVAVANGYAYLVGDRGADFRVLDVRDPAHPVEVGHLPLTSSGLSVSAGGDHVFVGCHGGQFLVVRVSEPSRPQVISSLDLGRSVLALESIGKTVFAAVEYEGFAAIEVSAPATPTLVGRTAKWPIQDVALGGGVAIVVMWDGSLSAVETGTPGRYLSEGVWPPPPGGGVGVGQEMGIALHSDWFCLVGPGQGLVTVRTRRGMLQYVERPLPERLSVDSAPISTAVTLSSELPANVRLLEGPATLDGGMLTVSGSGTVHLRIEQAGNEQFLPLVQDHYIQVLKMEQQLSWSAPATNDVLRWDVPVPLMATSSSGMAVQFRVKSGPAVIENGHIRATQAGRIVLVAEQAGDDRYLPVSEERAFNRPVASAASVGRWPRHELTNNISAVAVYGTYTLVGHSRGMQVIDLSRPGDPVEIGSVPSGSMSGIEVSGQTAWLALGYEARAVDLSDPRKPAMGLSLKPLGLDGNVTAVGVIGRAVYLAGNNLDVFDISDPEAPKRTTRLSLPGRAWAVRVSGDHAFLASDAGLLVLDVSHPMAPRLVKEVPEWSCRDLWVDGDRVFVAARSRGLAVFDLSNPSEPQLLGSLNTPGEAQGVCVVGNIAYVADGGPGVHAIDIVTPSSPTLRSTLDTPGAARAVALHDSTLLVADGLAGLQVAGLGNPGSPVRIGGFNLGTAYAVKLVGETAYLAYGTSGLEVLDVTDPNAPRWIGKYDTVGTASDVEVVGTRAFVADGSAGLVVLDLSDPASPSKLGGLDTSGEAWHVRVIGDRAYVADGASGLQIIDVSNPAVPRAISRFATQGFARRVDVVGTMAYVADTSRGLLQVRVDNPASPQLVRRTPFTGLTAGVFADGDRVWGTDGLLRVQSTPGSGFYSTRALGGVDLVALGNRVYAAAGEFGFRVVDVTDITDASVLGTFSLPAYAQSIRVSGDLAFVANDRAGLQIHRIREGLSQTLKFDPVALLELTNPSVLLEATASSGMPVTFGLLSGPALLTGNRLTFTNAGAVVVRAKQDGDAQFLPAIVDRTINGIRVQQSLSWGSLTNELLKRGQAYRLAPVASSGLPVTARVMAGPAHIVDGSLIVTNRGTVSIRLEQSGGPGYLPAESRRLFNLEGVAFTKVGTWPPTPRGYVTDVAVVDGLAFASLRSGGFTVWNLNSSAGPEYRGLFRQGFGSAGAIAVTNQIAYLTSSTDGLQVVDVSDPSNPRLLGQVAVHHNGVDLKVANDLAFVASWDAGIHLVNVADPTEPKVMGRLMTPGLANSVDVEGTRAYVAASEAGLLVVDVSNPAAPSLVGQFWTPGPAAHVRVDGGIVYVADTAGRLSLFGGSNPSAPALLAELPLEGVGRSIWVEGGRVQVVTTDGTVLIIDATNPQEPRILGRVDAAREGMALQGVGLRTYVAAGDDGIRIVDAADPAQPRLQSSFAESGIVNDVKVAGGNAFLADGGVGLRVLNLANPAEPSEVARLELDGVPTRIELVGDRALVSAVTGGFQLVDISQPRQPRLLARFNEASDNRAAALVGQFAVLANGFAGIQVVDLSDVPAIRSVGEAPVFGFAGDVETRGPLAFVVSDGLLDIFNVETGAAPSRLSHLGLPGGTMSVRWWNDLLLIAGGGSGVSFVDIVDPAQPRLLGTQPGFQSFQVEPLDRARLVVADGFRGVAAVDFTDPSFPGECGRFFEPKPARSIAVDSDLILVGAEAELQVLRWREGTVQRILFSPPEAVSLGQGLIPLQAEANSGLPVTLAVVSGPAVISGYNLVLTGAGNVVVRAEQAGDVEFLPADSVERTIRVMAPPRIKPETVRWLAPDRVEFRVAVVPGQSYAVYTSTDLVTWSEAVSRVATEADEAFTDSSATSHRYYRASAH